MRKSKIIYILYKRMFNVIKVIGNIESVPVLRVLYTIQ